MSSSCNTSTSTSNDDSDDADDLLSYDSSDDEADLRREKKEKLRSAAPAGAAAVAPAEDTSRTDGSEKGREEEGIVAAAVAPQPPFPKSPSGANLSAPPPAGESSSEATAKTTARAAAQRPVEANGEKIGRIAGIASSRPLAAVATSPSVSPSVATAPAVSETERKSKSKALSHREGKDATNDNGRARPKCSGGMLEGTADDDDAMKNKKAKGVQSTPVRRDDVPVPAASAAAAATSAARAGVSNENEEANPVPRRVPREFSYASSSAASSKLERKLESPWDGDDEQEEEEEEEVKRPAGVNKPNSKKRKRTKKAPYKSISTASKARPPATMTDSVPEAAATATAASVVAASASRSTNEGDEEGESAVANAAPASAAGRTTNEGDEEGESAAANAAPAATSTDNDAVLWKISDSKTLGARVYAIYPENGQWYWGNVVGRYWNKNKVLFEDGDVADDLTEGEVCTEKWFMDNLGAPPRPFLNRVLLDKHLSEAEDKRKSRRKSSKAKRKAAAKDTTTTSKETNRHTPTDAASANVRSATAASEGTNMDAEEEEEEEESEPAPASPATITWTISDSKILGARVYAEFPENGQWYWGNIVGRSWNRAGKRQYEILFEDGDVVDDLTDGQVFTEKCFVDKFGASPKPSPDKVLLEKYLVEAEKSVAKGKKKSPAEKNQIKRAHADSSAIQDDRKPAAKKARVDKSNGTNAASANVRSATAASEGTNKDAEEEEEEEEEEESEPAPASPATITWTISDSKILGARVYAEFPENVQWYWGNIVGRSWNRTGKRQYKIFFEDGDVVDDLTDGQVFTEKCFVDKFGASPKPSPDKVLLEKYLVEAEKSVAKGKKKSPAEKNQIKRAHADSSATQDDRKPAAKKARVDKSNGTTTTNEDTADDAVDGRKTAGLPEIVVVEEEAAKSRPAVDSRSDGSPFSLTEFIDMWEKTERYALHLTTEEIERGRTIRASNHDQVGEHDQSGAQYGRVMWKATQEIFDIAGLTRSKKLLDIGHGIGNAPLQGAYTIGCEARGIEIDGDRHAIALAFENHQEHGLRRQAIDTIASERAITSLLQEELQHLADSEDGLDGVITPPQERDEPDAVRLIEGNLRSAEHRTFLTTADVILANNAEGIFATRSEEKKTSKGKGKSKGKKKTKPSLDTHVAYLFALSKPGTVMVTLYPLPMLGHSCTKVNEMRKAQGLPESIDASFFEYRQETLSMKRREALSWAYERDSDEFIVHVYTRTAQSSSSPLFLCGDPKCIGSEAPTAAVDDDNNNSDLLIDECICCGESRISTRIYRKKAERFGF